MFRRGDAICIIPLNYCFIIIAACISHGGCKNGGRCLRGGRCRCKPGFKGKRCQLSSQSNDTLLDPHRKNETQIGIKVTRYVPH